MIYEMLQVHTRPWSMKELIVFVLFMIVEIVFLIIYRKREKIHIVQVCAIVAETLVMIMIYATTVFTRMPSGIRQYELMPGWSWLYIKNYASMELLKENILNIVLFFPVGLVMPFVHLKKTLYRKAWLFGFCFSAFIEINQLILCRGLFEWDDMIHNSLGCLLGCCVGNYIFKYLRSYMKK